MSTDTPTRNKGGRPRGSKGSPKDQRTIRAMIDHAHDVIRNGAIVVDPATGVPVLDPTTGKPRRRPPSAAFLNATLRLLDSLGAFEVAKKDPEITSRAKDYGVRAQLERLRAEGRIGPPIAVPPVPEDPDPYIVTRGDDA